MKKSFLLLVALASFLVVRADNVMKVNDELLEKEFVYIAFDYDQPGNLLVQFADSTILSLNMNQVEILPNEASSVEGVKTNQSFFSFKGLVGDELRLDGVEPGSTIQVFSAGGALMLSEKVAASQHAVNVSNLKKGVYLLRVGKQAVKFTKN